METSSESPSSTNAIRKPTLVVADDHNLVLEGLVLLLSRDFDVVATVADGWAAVDAFERHRPDVLVLDIGLPLLNGIEATRHVMRHTPNARIVMMTMQTARPYVIEAFNAGALGYVLKEFAFTELAESIRMAMEGERYISPALAARVGAIPGEPRTENGAGPTLTPRQREVLQLIAEGRSMKQMAHILNISVRTIEFHKNSLIQALGVRTTAELTRWALNLGMVTSQPPI